MMESNETRESAESKSDTRRPLKCAYSREEMITAARKYLIEQRGKPAECANRDRWMEDFGLLCAFVIEQFPEDDRR